MDRKIGLSMLAAALAAVLAGCSGVTPLSAKSVQNPPPSVSPTADVVARAAGDAARGAKDAAEGVVRGAEDAARDMGDAARDMGDAIGFDRMVDDARWPVRETNTGHN